MASHVRYSWGGLAAASHKAEFLTRAAAKPRLPGPPQVRALSYPHAKRGFPLPSTPPSPDRRPDATPLPGVGQRLATQRFLFPVKLSLTEGRKGRKKISGAAGRLTRSNPSNRWLWQRRREGESEPPGRACRRPLGRLFQPGLRTISSMDICATYSMAGGPSFSSSLPKNPPSQLLFFLLSTISNTNSRLGAIIPVVKAAQHVRTWACVA